MKHLKTLDSSTAGTRACILLFVLVVYLFLPVVAASSESTDTFEFLSEDYADAMLNIEDKSELKQRLGYLLEKATVLRDTSGSPESIYLLARITYGSSTNQSVFGVRRAMRVSKELIEQALKIDEELLSGTPKALLGYLYVGLPGWPMSFGDKDKGLELLKEAMAIDDQNMSNNYFFAGGLIREGNYEAARDQLIRARELADSNSSMVNMQALILREINSDLRNIEERLSH
ncbi:MAG: hypothetical protein COA96_02940 [SAR86 cluster bacterium]|uniref:Tetratricopeptide repeat protein n=1 Tax=SAR86 cluster bacterium TaxID=2030880 RepID=A0A2A5B814_9GAMM|nr:MAG: hypothetical protein COA96_02940 [SAR86 cluster bacterium]